MFSRVQTIRVFACLDLFVGDDDAQRCESVFGRRGR